MTWWMWVAVGAIIAVVVIRAQFMSWGP
jgi:hypothetical protein